MSNEPAAGLALSEQQVQDLRCLAGMMIPASAEYAVPGADDALIFADVVKSLGRDMGVVQTALRDLGDMAGGSLARLEPARREAVAAVFHAGGGEGLAVLHRVVLLCYYRDDRVMRSLNMEPRPPFPLGFTVEQGDWSLLAPVRGRPKLWRDAS